VILKIVFDTLFVKFLPVLISLSTISCLWIFF